MKVLVTTIVDNVNYGTYLQAYATVKLLRDRGCDVEVLNYTRPHLTHRAMLKSAAKGGVVALVRGFVAVIFDAAEKWNLRRFLTGRVKMTESFSDWKSFRSRLGRYDLYLVGSDQVWNTVHNKGIDGTFFFEGIEGLKESYASSIGTDSFDNKDRDSLTHLLSGFSKLTVRESFGVDTLRQLGFGDVEQVLDPTLMLTGDDWRGVCGNKFTKTEPYLLIYSVEVSKDLQTIEMARKIADERHLRLYLVSPYVKFKSRLNVDKVFAPADTEMFLSLFANADYAVVSSFHGTAFAVNFNCQFVTVAPERFSSRVLSLLKLLGLDSRYISNADEIPAGEIDYVRVNEILDCERAKAKAVIGRLGIDNKKK